MSSQSSQEPAVGLGRYNRSESTMNASDTTHRRGFLSRMAGAAAAASVSIVGGAAVAAPESGSDDWIKEVKGTHRCLFDFPQHRNGIDRKSTRLNSSHRCI